MELSDKQYNEMERYVAGEMEAGEMEVFEAALLRDNALAEEVEAYKEIFALADSLEQKIGELVQHSADDDPPNKEVLGMLEKERKYWEEHHEPELKRMYGLTGPEETNIVREEPRGRIIGINRKRWLAAAVVIGLLGLSSVVWWYIQPESKQASIAIHPKKTDTDNIVDNNKNGNSQKDLAGKKTESPGFSNNTVNDTAVKKQEYPKRVLDGAEQQQQLYAQNFVPDAPPQERTLLEDAFEYYEKGNYKQASSAYEEAQKEVESLTTRTVGDEQEEAESKRILFYAHYYNALSYMSAGNTTKAIRELKAIKESPDEYWHSKQQWYLALAYLKTGEAAKATTLLQQVAISNGAGEYRQKAIQLSKALQKE
jgi:hypothetical protein